MSAPEASPAGHRLRAIPFALSFAVAMIIAYALCVAAALVLPGLPLAHGWVALFTTAPMGSGTSWLEGIVGSTWFGLLLGLVVATTYNLITKAR